MNRTHKSLVTLLTAAALLALLGSVQAADKTAPATPAKGAETQKKNTRYPIHGKLAAVDKAGKTFTIKGAEKDRVFKVNAQTKITKHGKTATLADAVVGEDVGGYVEKQSDGSVLALSVRFGPKPADEADEVKKPAVKDKPKTPAPK
jgi:hypothetical protein